MRGLIISMLGAAAVAALEALLFLLLRACGVRPDVALLALAIFSLVMLLGAGVLMLLHLQRLGAAEEAPRLPWQDEFAGGTANRPEDPASYSAELWQAAAQLEAKVREIHAQSDVDYIRVVAEPVEIERAKPPAEPPPAAKPRVEEPVRQEPRASFDQLSSAQLMKELDEYGRRLAVLVNRSRARINDLERLMENRIHLVGSETIRAHMNAKRIVEALERRSSQVQEQASLGQVSDLARARALLEADLTLPTDCMNTVVGMDEMRTLSIGQCRPTLDRCLCAAEASLRELDQRSKRVSY